MKPLTNETLEKIGTTFAGELIGSIALGIGHTPTEIKDAIGEVELIELLEEHDKKIASALQAKEEEMKEKIKSKKKYWHIRFEGISDPVISAERKKFNEEVSELINSVLDDLLSNLSEK